MRKRLPRSLCVAVMIMALLLASRPSLACGPFSLDAIFTFTAHPEFPLEKFARGELGMIQPSYARSYLFVAYRYLSGRGFNAQEQKVLQDFWAERLDGGWLDYDNEWPKQWLEDRKKIPGVGPDPKISVYRHREKPNEYDTYVNCQKDAFDNAATTLQSRAKQFGMDSQPVRDWVAAQDQVFANCSEGSTIPAAATGDSPQLIRADRSYQIAAANFYASNLDEARSQFESIAKDSTSPWRETAPYLAARALVRNVSLGPAEGKQEALAAAEKRLREILADRRLSATHTAAGRLLNLVRVRFRPEDKVRELAQSLSKNADGDSLKQELWDYTAILDQLIGDDQSEGKRKPLPPIVLEDDLTDWIATYQSSGPGAMNHALEMWNKKASLPWLVAALAQIDASNARTAELLNAAAKIRPDSPGFASVIFQRVRLEANGGRSNEARALLDDILTTNRSALPVSTLNLLLAQRLRLANNLTELLTYAQRVPAGYSYNDDGRETAAELSEDSTIKPLVGQPLFDLDAANLLNKKLPLSLLKEAATSTVLPKHLRRDVAQAAWIRAVVLDDAETASELVPTVKSLIPSLRPFLDDYLAASQPDEKKFTAIYTWLKWPGLEPVVDAGVGRTTALEQQDEFRDNWWCSAAFTNDTNEAKGETEADKLQTFKADSDVKSPQFLTPAQRAAAQRESTRLSSFGAAPNYLCGQVIAWAEKRPNDPRVPEALHLAVKSTRYGCTDKATGRSSKAAFDVLHKRYPNSPWAKKTPYWFKD
jgi:hypothetical protein